MSQIAHPYRVFISYAHDDKVLVEQIIHVLKSLGFHVLWDADINPGKSFTDEIKSLITRSHLVMPIITKHSQYRPWVDQEIGIAIALNIPIVPIAIGVMPGGLITEIQAIEISPELTALETSLQAVEWENLILSTSEQPYIPIEIADPPEERAKCITKYANWVATDIGEPGRVRSIAKLTVGFSIPDSDLSDPKWKAREGNKSRSKYFLELQRKERQALEHHAQEKGCWFIIDPTATTFTTRSRLGRKTRLIVLNEFLTSMLDQEDLVEVVFSAEAQKNNLVIVGDYFSAESKVPGPGEGHKHTIITSHAPTVLAKIRAFDHLFNKLKQKQAMTLRDVIRKLEQYIAEA